jgi:hypothetical protein
MFHVDHVDMLTERPVGIHASAVGLIPQLTIRFGVIRNIAISDLAADLRHRIRLLAVGNRNGVWFAVAIPNVRCIWQSFLQRLRARSVASYTWRRTTWQHVRTQLYRSSSWPHLLRSNQDSCQLL